MEDKLTLEQRLKNLETQRAQLVDQHDQMTAARAQIGARINAVDGAIETVRSIMGAPVPAPKNRAERRQTTRKKTTKKK